MMSAPSTAMSLLGGRLPIPEGWIAEGAAHGSELCEGPTGIDGGGRLMELSFDFGPPKLGKKDSTGKKREPVLHTVGGGGG